MSEQWECGPHTNAWNGHDARCRRVPAPPAGTGEALTQAEVDRLDDFLAEADYELSVSGLALLVAAVERIMADRRAAEGDLRARIERVEALCDKVEEDARHHWSRGPDGQSSVSTLSTQTVRAALAQPTTDNGQDNE